MYVLATGKGVPHCEESGAAQTAAISRQPEQTVRWWHAFKGEGNGRGQEGGQSTIGQRIIMGLLQDPFVDHGSSSADVPNTTCKLCMQHVFLVEYIHFLLKRT